MTTGFDTNVPEFRDSQGAIIRGSLFVGVFDNDPFTTFQSINLFSDTGLTQALSNPLSIDEDGRVGQFYTSETNYSYGVTDASGQPVDEYTELQAYGIDTELSGNSTVNGTLVSGKVRINLADGFTFADLDPNADTNDPDTTAPEMAALIEPDTRSLSPADLKFAIDGQAASPVATQAINTQIDNRTYDALAEIQALTSLKLNEKYEVAGVGEFKVVAAATSPYYVDATAGATNFQLKPLNDDARLFGLNTALTDNSTALGNAMIAAVGGKLFIPKGVYNFTAICAVTLTKSLDVYCEDDTEFVFQTNRADGVIDVLTDGHDFNWYRGSIDGSDLVHRLFNVRNSLDTDESDVKIDGLSVKNARWVSGDSAISCDGIAIIGNMGNVDIINCDVTGINRDTGQGVVSSQGSAGITVTHLGLGFHPHIVNIRGNRIDTIWTDTDGAVALNADCDGIAAFSPSTETLFNIRGNRLKNCKGRSIKGQAYNPNLEGNTIIRDKAKSINGGMSEINLQYGNGSVINNNFYYYEDTGLSPFTPTGTGTGGIVANFFSAADPAILNGNPVVKGNRVYNHVGEAQGVIGSYVGLLHSTYPTYYTVKTVEDNHMIGGAVDNFIDTGENGVAARCLIDFVGNSANMKTSAVNTSASATLLLEVRGSGIVNTGTDVPFAQYLSGFANGQFEVSNSIGFTKLYRDVRGSNQLIAHRMSSDYASNSGFTHQSVTLADDATHVFEVNTHISPRGIHFITNNFADSACGIIIADTATLTLITTSTSLAVNATNPDTDTKLNVYISGGAIAIKNRLGSSREFALFSMG